MNKELKDGLIRFDGTAKMSKKDGQETGIYMMVILAAKIKVKIHSEMIKKSLDQIPPIFPAMCMCTVN